MKSILFAIVCLAASVSAAQVCTLTCSGNWTGQSSVAVEIGGDVEILYDVEHKIFGVINTNLNLSIAVNGKFVFILNITSGKYLLIDIATQYAVIGSIQIDFISSGGEIIYAKFIEDVSLVFSKYTSITSSTPGSFNFGLIIVAFYAGNFNLVSIVGQTIAAELSASFGIWLKLVQNAIVSGSLALSYGIWGFLTVVINVDISISLAIFEVIRISIEVYREIRVELIRQIVVHIQQNIQSIINFSIKIVSYISIVGNASITSLINFANNVANNPVSLNITLGGSSYALLVIKIDGQYVIQLAASSGSTQQLNLQFIFASNVLIIYNLKTNMAVALYQRNLLVVNTTAEIGLLYSWQLFTGLKVGVVNTVNLSADIRAGFYSRAAADVKAIIKASSSSLTVSWTALYKAVISKSLSAVGALVGSQNASFVIYFYGSFCVETSGSTSIGNLVVAGFAGSVSGSYGLLRGLASVLGVLISTLASTTQSWSTVVTVLTGGVTISG